MTIDSTARAFIEANIDHYRELPWQSKRLKRK